MNQNKFLLVGAVAFLVVGTLVAGKLFSQQALGSYQSEIESQLEDTETLLQDLAAGAARNGTSAASEAVVRDCKVPERERFDFLLGQLDAGLSGEELAELDGLFGRCGDFYAQQLEVTAVSLKDTVRDYQNLIELLKSLSVSVMQYEDKLDAWQSLSDIESKRAGYFTTLVNEQQAIILALIDGQTIDSPDLEEVLNRVAETQENLLLLNTQAGSIRAELLPVY